MRESIKIPNSVIVSGLTETDADNEVSTYLEKYGSINRFFRIDEPASYFHKHMIVEFTHGAAMQTLEPLLPLKLECHTQADTVYVVRSLAGEYALDARTNATRAYMKELYEIAKLSGNSLEQMLKEELATLSSSATPSQTCPDPSPEQRSVPRVEQLIPGDLSSSPSPHPMDSPHPAAAESLHDTVQPCVSSIPNKNLIDLPSLPSPPVTTDGKSQCTLDLNPSSIQRVLVEHVVRNSESPPYSPTPNRLRAFSGRTPRPNSEADYDTWRTSVEVLIKDPSVSDLHCTHRILDSLLPPAAEMTRHLGPGAQPSSYLEILDSAYGTVEDGDELYAKFMNTLQDEGEKPSNFLHRLHGCLSMAMRRGGVSAPDVDRQLLKQFCRGCWDNALITDLKLEQRRESPPSFAELLLLLRTKEDQQATKVNRMRQHLGATKTVPSGTKQRVMSHLQTAHDTAESEYEVLKKQLADLSTQLSNMKPKSHKQNQTNQQKSKSPAANAKVEAQPLKKKAAQQQTPPTNSNSRPRPWYCFQCGEDGHIVSACENEPNPSLVAAKRKQLRERQANWDKSNVLDGSEHLN